MRGIPASILHRHLEMRFPPYRRAAAEDPTLTHHPMRRKILVLEDDRDLRDTILGVLKSAGFHALTAGNGREAFRILTGLQEPALVLLDLKMPAVDGFEFRRRIRETPGLSETPVVLLSGDWKSQRHAGTHDSRGPLTKPFREEDLLRVVARYCAD